MTVEIVNFPKGMRYMEADEFKVTINSRVFTFSWVVVGQTAVSP